MYKYLLHIYNPLYTLFLIPVCLCILFILSDYLLIPKPTINTALTQANIYSHLKGKPCKASITIESHWGNGVFETKNVNDSICKSEYKEISITHTTLLRRWLVLATNEEKHYFVDKAIITDILFLAFSIFAIYGVFKGKLNKHFKYPKLIIVALPLVSLHYLYTYAISQWI